MSLSEQDRKGFIEDKDEKLNLKVDNDVKSEQLRSSPRIKMKER
jgi:hypothetical protein